MMKHDPAYLKHLASGDRPIPGQSLTSDPEAPRPFEQPPKYVSIHEASEFIFMNLIKEDVYLGVMRQLIDGRSLMEMTQVTLFGGFYKGLWNPDLMLMLVEPVAYMILALAERAEIDPKIYEGEEQDDFEEQDLTSSAGDGMMLQSLQKRSKSLQNLPANVTLDKEQLAQITDLPSKEEIIASKPSLIGRPEDEAPVEESLIAPPEPQEPIDPVALPETEELPNAR